MDVAAVPNSSTDTEEEGVTKVVSNDNSSISVMLSESEESVTVDSGNDSVDDKTSSTTIDNP